MRTTFTPASVAPTRTRHGGHLALLLACVTLAVVLVLPATAAYAASVARDGTTITYTAAIGERNNVSVNGGILIGDSGAASMVDGDGAGGCSVTGPGAATCPPDGVTMLILNLGDQDDNLHSFVDIATTVTGGEGTDQIRTGAGADDLDGGDGNDTLTGRFGPDVLTGGIGFDTVSYDGHTQPITASVGGAPGEDGSTEDELGGQRDDIQGDIEVISGGSGNDELIGDPARQNLLIGMLGNDRLVGGAGGNTLIGGAGDDSLEGGAGLDGLFADAGADTLSGGPGPDQLNGGIGPDDIDGGEPGGGVGGDIVFYDRTEDLTITLPSVHTSGGPSDEANGRRDSLSGIESVFAGTGHDTLTGSGADENLSGGGGNDVISGGGGLDGLSGGLGDDALTGGGGQDGLSGGEGADTLNAIDETQDFSVDCGPDVDVANIDSIDRFGTSPAFCETVNEAAPCPVGSSAPGALDVSFGCDGIVTLPFSGGAAGAFGVADQADGRLVAAGYGPGSDQFGLARLLASGEVDTGFGTGGLVSWRPNLGGHANDVLLQPDGKIVAVGFEQGYGFAVARHLSDGALDTSFDGDGVVTLQMPGYADAVANSGLIQPDGKLVLVGRGLDTQTSEQHFILVRLNADGSLDTSFDVDGMVTTTFTVHGGATGFAVARQGDGKLVAAGATVLGQFALSRYNTDGSTDTGFGTGGTVVHDVGVPGGAAARDVAIDSHGRIVAGGNVDNGTYLGVARYRGDGTPDPTFDGDGAATTNFEGVPMVRDGAIALDGSDRVLVTGSGSPNDGDSFQFLLARFQPTGALDAGFDGDGKVTTQVGVSARAKDVDMLADGGIVVAGEAVESGSADSRFAFARYNGGGAAAPYPDDPIPPGPPAIDVEPASLDFGEVPVATRSAPRAVTIRNPGGSLLDITSFTFSGHFGRADTGFTCDVDVPPGGSCVIPVQFVPNALGPTSGTLTIHHNVPPFSHTVTLSGIGSAVGAPQLTLSSASLDFGEVIVGMRSAPKEVTLTNTGTAPLNVSEVRRTGHFARNAPSESCARTLASNESCTIDAVYAPVSPGRETGEVTIFHNAPGSPHTIALSGTGLAANAAPAAPGPTPGGSGAPKPLGGYRIIVDDPPPPEHYPECDLNVRRASDSICRQRTQTQLAETTTSQVSLGATTFPLVGSSALPKLPTQFISGPTGIPYAQVLPGGGVELLSPGKVVMEKGQLKLVDHANPANVIAAGAGHVIAAGGGNIIAAGGGQLLAAGGARVIAAGAGMFLEKDGVRYAEIRPDGRIIAAGSGNVIAAGAGMFHVTDKNGRVIAAGAGNIIAAGAANIIAAGAGHIIAAGGNNIIAAGAGNVIAAGGGQLLAAGGAMVIAAGGGHFLEKDGQRYAEVKPDGRVIAAGSGNVIAAGAGMFKVTDSAGRIIAAGAGHIVRDGVAANVIAAGAGHVIAAGAGHIIAAGAGHIIAAGGANIIAAGGGNVVLMKDGVTYGEIEPDGRIIAAGAGQVIASGAGMFHIVDEVGNVIAAGGGNVIAAGGGHFDLLGGSALLSNGNLQSLSSTVPAWTQGALESKLSTLPSFGLRGASAARRREVVLGSGRVVFKRLRQRRVLKLKINRRGRSLLAKTAKINRARRKAHKRPLKLRLTFTNTFKPKKGRASSARRSLSVAPGTAGQGRR